MTRHDHIRNRLSTFLLDEQSCAVACPTKEAVSAWPVTGHLFGWYPPMPIEGNNMLPLVMFCPELMAEITDDLSDEELDTYLTVVEVLLDGYLTAMVTDPTLPPEDVRRVTESHLFDTAPEMLALFSHVELRALDRGLVARP